MNKQYKPKCPKCGELTMRMITFEPEGLDELRFVSGKAFDIGYINARESFKCNICGHSFDGRTVKYVPLLEKNEPTEYELALELFCDKVQRELLENNMKRLELDAAIECVKTKFFTDYRRYCAFVNNGECRQLNSAEVALMVVLEAAMKYERLVYGQRNRE